MNPNNIISGHSHSFDSGIAQKIGINAAIVYNHIVYWIKINASKKDYKTIEGKYWMYETMIQMSEFLEYLSLDDVKRAISKLLESGLLIKGCFNNNPFDRTAWYTVHDQSIIKKQLTKEQPCTIDQSTPALSESAPLHFAESTPAPCLYTTEQCTLNKEQQNKQEEDVSVSVCPSDKDLSCIPSENSIDDRKRQAFNWFLKIGCDVVSAKFFIDNFSIEDISLASGYVKDQIEKKKKKKEYIADVVAYLRRTLEGKWWIKKK